MVNASGFDPEDAGSIPTTLVSCLERENKMTNSEKLMILENRYLRLKEKPKCIKCPGVLRKIAREIRNLKNKGE